jgi:hypothetical protein
VSITRSYQSFRPGDRERFAALAEELGIQHEERNAAEVIGMEMGDHDQADGVALDPQLLQRHQRRSAAVDQQVGPFTGKVKAGVEPAARPEGIAAPDELQRQCH